MICHCINRDANTASGWDLQAELLLAVWLEVLVGGGCGIWEETAFPVLRSHSFDNTEDRDEHKLIHEEESEIWASRMMERRQWGAQTRWAHPGNCPVPLWWPTKPIKSLEKNWIHRYDPEPGNRNYRQTTSAEAPERGAHGGTMASTDLSGRLCFHPCLSVCQMMQKQLNRFSIIQRGSI